MYEFRRFKRRCFCFAESKAPSWRVFFNAIKRFYESETLLARLKPFGVEPDVWCLSSAVSKLGWDEAARRGYGKIPQPTDFGDLDDSLYLSYVRQRSEFESALTLLDTTFKVYLMKAVMGELRHTLSVNTNTDDGEHCGDRYCEECEDSYRRDAWDKERILEFTQELGLPRDAISCTIKKQCNCDHCRLSCSCVNYGRACCYVHCTGRTSKDNEREKRQHAWWVPCPIHDAIKAVDVLAAAHQVFTDLPWSSSYGGPAWAHIALVLAGRLVRNPEKHKYWKNYSVEMTVFQDDKLFVDHTLDLQHNNGTVFGKGWIHVQVDALRRFQDKKATGKLEDWCGEDTRDLRRVAVREQTRDKIKEIKVNGTETQEAAPPQEKRELGVECDCKVCTGDNKEHVKDRWF